MYLSTFGLVDSSVVVSAVAVDFLGIIIKALGSCLLYLSVSSERDEYWYKDLLNGGRGIDRGCRLLIVSIVPIKSSCSSTWMGFLVWLSRRRSSLFIVTWSRFAHGRKKKCRVAIKKQKEQEG